MTRPGRALLLALLAASRATAAPLDEVRKAWPKLDAPARLSALRSLGKESGPAKAISAACAAWLDDPSAPVRAEAFRLLLSVDRDPAPAAAYVGAQLDLRARKERREFEETVRKHGRKLPPDDQIAAGRDWEDPWDERRRPLTPEARAEREHWMALLGAIEEHGGPLLLGAALRIFREHHDPEVLVRAARCFGARKEWRAMPEMADLARIQAEGRGVGGSVVIGEEAWSTMRLKWDVHKDRLWWSRPEYVPRVSRPIFEAASAIAGAPISSSAQLDRWLLGHETELAAKGVRLDAAFRARAASTQR